MKSSRMWATHLHPLKTTPWSPLLGLIRSSQGDHVISWTDLPSFADSVMEWNPLTTLARVRINLALPWGKTLVLVNLALARIMQ